jgi:hypothetical protein
MNPESIIAALTIPGLPGWTGLLAALALALLALCFLVMPFSVFGLKSRLESIEAQLDEVQAELRAISARLANAPRLPLVMDDLEMPSPPRANESRTPSTGRAEPRINWPREPR